MTYPFNMLEPKNRFMGLAFIKVRNAIEGSQKQHYESLRKFVWLYIRREPEVSKKTEIMQLFLDKLDKSQW